MRGWFPRRCAVEAVDHYDSCQVRLFSIFYNSCQFFPPWKHFQCLLLSFQVGKRKDSCKDVNQSSQKKSRETKKKKWGRKRLETVGEIKLTPSHPFPTVLLSSFILISWHAKRPIVYSRIVNNHWWWEHDQINDILNPTDPRNWAKIIITGFTICELTSDCVSTKNIHDESSSMIWL